MENKSKAVLYMLLSCLSFSFMNVMIKVSGDIPMFQRIFFMNGASLIFAYIIARKNKRNLFGHKESRKYLFTRALFGYLALITNFYSISKLLLADSSILNKLSPFFVIIFAFIFLKEKLSKAQIPILLLVFLGALLVIKPQFNLDALPAFSGVLSAIFSGAAYTLLRFLGDKEDFSTILFYFSLVSMIGTLPIMIMKFKVPSYIQVIMLIAMGLFWVGGQSYMTLAYKFAPAGEISIYSYATIIFSTILGFIVLKEYPDILSFMGGVLIIAAGGMNFYYGKRQIKIQENK
ncbi:DMT family transporter [Clostridium ganghwense]|uniref:DMT family transporter n=1 Tax=Clostridium ganghwense TaxID=312089 RepID=A0ABT4CPJ9_9CLOT|nr:DMT family transporter [Clostridium ganghwense]MCY6370006.1 DMT family transporter [Clostridium ganghwense]